jgi:lipopolysaccharide transport system permease protein
MLDPTAIVPVSSESQAIPPGLGASSVGNLEPTEIAPSRGWSALKLHELWHYRELLYFLVWRDIKVRYKQTLLGAAWAILQPVMTALVFSLFFGRLARMPSDGIPYPLFSLCALVPWTFLANGVMLSSNSLVGNAQLITKVYFPRLAVPLATVLSGLVDLALALLVLVAAMGVYGVTPGPRSPWILAYLLLALATALGVGLWLSALNVQFRDVRYVVPFLIQFWMFATPIAYPASLLKKPWQRILYGVNPMVGVVEGFRWAMLGVERSPGAALLVSSAVAFILLVSGAFYFRRMERTFADVI